MKNIWLTAVAMLVALNQVSVSLSGDTILVLLFGTALTFAIVGIVLELWNVPRGKFGSAFGKFAFWLIGIPVSFVLNVIGKMIL